MRRIFGQTGKLAPTIIGVSRLGNGLDAQAYMAWAIVSASVT